MVAYRCLCCGTQFDICAPDKSWAGFRADCRDQSLGLHVTFAWLQYSVTGSRQ